MSQMPIGAYGGWGSQGAPTSYPAAEGKPKVHNHGPNKGPGLDCGEKYVNGFLQGNCMRSELEDGPHSRACGVLPHSHGAQCHSNCQTCGGKPFDIPPAPGNLIRMRNVILSNDRKLWLTAEAAMEIAYDLAEAGYSL